MTAVVTRPITSRPTIDSRWDRALDRARSEGLRLRAGSQAGHYIVISGDRTYQATVDTCTCTAGQLGDPCCKHRAAVRAAEKLANASKPQKCTTCAGHGWVSDDGGYSAYRCLICEGRGSTPALRIVVSNDDPEPDPSTPAPSAATPERIAELQERPNRGFEAIGEAVRKLEEAGYFEQWTENVQVAA